MRKLQIVHLMWLSTLAILLGACRVTPPLDWPARTRMPLPDRFALAWPDWSPDGSQIVVASIHAAAPTLNYLYVVTVADGSYVSPGLQSDYVEPHWSPDGSRFVMWGWDGLNIVSFPDFQAGPRILGHNAAWSPDGERLALYHSGSGPPFGPPSKISVSDLDGNILVDLFDDSVGATAYYQFGGLAWSEASNQIVFSWGTATTATIWSFHRNIYLADPDTGETQLLIDSPTDDYSPSWSPDGEWLVYIADPDRPNGRATIMFARVDGSCTIPTLSAAWLTGVDWSPDGTRLAVTHFDSLYVVDMVATFGDGFGDLDGLCTNP